MSGIFHHSSQVTRGAYRNCPTSLLIGNFVAVAQCVETDKQDWPKTSMKNGVRVGLITDLIQERPPSIEVEWYGSDRSNILQNTKWKVCTGKNRVAVISLDNILTTWD